MLKHIYNLPFNKYQLSFVVQIAHIGKQIMTFRMMCKVW